MADRNFNRDRNRPYDEDYDQGFYDQDFRSRGNYDRDYGYGYDQGGNRDYGMNDQNYGYSGSRFYGRSGSRNMNRGNMGGGYNAMNRNRYGGYGYNQDYDYDYDTDFGNQNRRMSGGYGNYRGRPSGQGFGNPGRNYGAGGTGWGGYGGNYGRNYGGGGRFGNMNRGSMGYYGNQGYDSDFDTEYGDDMDYEFDNEPVDWTYEEIWLIPGPYSGVGPEGYRRSDERIREDIHERMTQHGQLNARNIQVQVKDGEVTLTGTVDNRQAKRIAEDVVESVSVVKDVHNQLTVQERQKNQQHMGQQQGQGQQNQQQMGQPQGQNGQRQRS